MKDCCTESMKRYIKKHRDVATCDRCGDLLLGYGNQRDFEETRKALTAQGMPFEIGQIGSLHVIGKPRLKRK